MSSVVVSSTDLIQFGMLWALMARAYSADGHKRLALIANVLCLLTATSGAVLLCTGVS